MIRQGQLPTLTGSEKQVEWAIRLRNEAISQLNDELAERYAHAKGNSQVAHIPQFIHAVEITEQALVQALMQRTEAKWWIDAFMNGYKVKTACAHAIEKDAVPFDQKLTEEWKAAKQANAIYVYLEEFDGQYRGHISKPDGTQKRTAGGKRSEVMHTVLAYCAPDSLVSDVEFVDAETFAQKAVQ